MNVQTMVKDMKGRVEPYVAKGQEVVTMSADTLKKANGVLLSGVQSLVKAQVEAGKDFFASTQKSFEKAKSDGIKAVAASPIKYLPEREPVLAAYSDTLSVVTKTSGELAKLVKQGFEQVSNKLTAGSTPNKASSMHAKPRGRKAARKSSAAKKTIA